MACAKWGEVGRDADFQRGRGDMDDNAVVLQSNTQRDQEPDHGAEGHQDDSLEAISLTVLVPTRNEAGNVAKLLDDLSAALEGVSAEVVFVDDSDDSTPAVI